ncbi:MAG TPA: acetamidase/formamidase family protein [Acidimicrobiales bacterium]|nr:acetamidase/formamidase family protein [Acidimicrobiales bacterium]
MATHTLDPTPTTTVDVFDASLPPVCTLDPGDTLTVGALDASGHLEAQRHPGDRDRPTMFPSARGHCLTGPIEVRGARPGQVLAVEIRSVTPGSWGWTVAGARATPITERLAIESEAWLLWAIDAGAAAAVDQHGHRVPLAPFLGVVGVPPAEGGAHSTIPPRPEGGGNIDCRDLVAGSTLYLPVTVPGAMLCLGDGHAAQGHGEVCGTAIECPTTSEVRVGLLDAAEVPVGGVHAEAPVGRITFGFDADLNAATGDALDAAVTWVARLTGTDRVTALALASATVDLHVTQVANGTWGVHAVIPWHVG